MFSLSRRFWIGLSACVLILPLAGCSGQTPAAPSAQAAAPPAPGKAAKVQPGAAGEMQQRQSRADQIRAEAFRRRSAK